LKKLKVFHIPSWYPAQGSPLSGLFIREQINLLAESFPDSVHGVSTWGQNDHRLLLQKEDGFRNFSKFFHCSKKQRRQILANFVEYFSPAYTWTRKWAGGNISGIIKANLQHLHQFETEFGRPDIIMAHVSYPAGFIAFHLSQQTGIPYVISEHMDIFPFPSLADNKRKPIKSIEVALLNASLIYTPSNSLRMRILAFYPKLQIDIIPNFLRFSDYTATEYPPSDTLQLAYLGRIEESKGLLLMAEALIGLPFANWVWVLAGEGPAKTKIQAKMDAAGLGHKVEWIGLLEGSESKNEFFRRHCHVFVTPSLHESFGITVLEAAASGRPVIATRCGGPEEIITSQMGLLIEPGNVSALKDALIEMAETLNNYPPAVIHNCIAQRYDVNQVGAIWMQKLQETVGSKKG
jgi:glycosyltransferase involved in cell wall biosynthesis